MTRMMITCTVYAFQTKSLSPDKYIEQASKVYCSLFTWKWNGVVDTRLETVYGRSEAYGWHQSADLHLRSANSTQKINWII